MSPVRIGSIELIVFMIRPMLNGFADLGDLDGPLGLLGRDPRRLGVEDRHHHLGTSPHALVDVQLHLARGVVHIGDVAVGVIENSLLALDLVAQLADDRGERVLLAGVVALHLLDLRGQVGVRRSVPGRSRSADR